MNLCNCSSKTDEIHKVWCNRLKDAFETPISDGGPDIASLNDPVRTKKETPKGINGFKSPGICRDEELQKMKPDSITGNDHGVMREERMRTFEGGATRHTDDGKIDYEGFLSPWALRRYGQYMSSHRIQADGKIRDSDNWQAGSGIPQNVYMKSLLRHTLDAHAVHRGLATYDTKDDHEVDIEEALCAILFNAFGYLHEHLKEAAKFQKRRDFAEAEFQKRVRQAAGDGVDLQVDATNGGGI